MASSSNVVQFNPARIRIYLFRLPLFTRLCFLAIVAFWIAGLFLKWIPLWGALVPSEVGLTTMYRLNTFPIVHSGTLQTFLQLVPLIPLLERFEGEHGTLVSAALFFGPFSTLPGFLYILFDHILFRANHTIQGASIWCFLLLGCEAIKTYKANPNFSLGPYKIPTWTYPFGVLLAVELFIPNTSILGHACSILIGYGFELGYLKFLIPPEKILRFIESKLNLLGRLPHYVSVDQKTFGRYGVLPTRETPDVPVGLSVLGTAQRLGSTPS